MMSSSLYNPLHNHTYDSAGHLDARVFPPRHKRCQRRPLLWSEKRNSTGADRVGADRNLGERAAECAGRRKDRPLVIVDFRANVRGNRPPIPRSRIA